MPDLPKLGEDHTRALRLWDGLRERGWAVEDRPASNMVYVRVPDAPGWVATLETRGVRGIALAWDRVRLVTHLDVDDAGVERAIEASGGA